MHEVWAQHLGDGEHSLGVAEVGDHLVVEESRELGGALGPAAGAGATPLAGESEQELLGAVRAAHASEAPVEDATVEVAGDHACE